MHFTKSLFLEVLNEMCTEITKHAIDKVYFACTYIPYINAFIEASFPGLFSHNDYYNYTII